jgi:hypothetical protein
MQTLYNFADSSRHLLCLAHRYGRHATATIVIRKRKATVPKSMTFFPQRMFDIPPFARLISRTPTLKELDESEVWILFHREHFPETGSRRESHANSQILRIFHR